MERILLKQDNDTFDQIIRDLRSFQPYLVEVGSAYNKLGIGDFDGDTFDIIKSSPQEIEARFRFAIETEVEKSGLSRESLKRVFLDHNEPLIQEFILAARALMAFTPTTGYSRTKYLSVKHISYNEINGFHISDDSKNHILDESCRVFVETENEQKLYNGLIEFGSAWKSLEAVLIEVGALEFFKQYHKLMPDELIIESEGKYIPKSDAVKLVSFMERQKQEQGAHQSRAMLEAKRFRDEKAEINRRFDDGTLINIIDPTGHHKRLAYQQKQ